MTTDITPETLPPAESLVADVNRRVWSEVQFNPHVYYSDYVRQPEYSSKDKPLGNCNLLAAKAAQAIIENYGEEYLAYIGHCNSHCFALAVSDKDVHFINADSPGLSVAGIDRAGLNGGPLFFDTDTIAELREGGDFIYSKNARPSEIMTSSYSALSQAWADAPRSAVGVVKWPLADKYLVMHSQVRKILKSAGGVYAFPEEDIDTAISTYRQLRPFDVAIDDSPTSYETKTYTSENGLKVHALFRNATIRTAVARYASLATNEAELAKCGVLAEVLYQETGPGFIVSVQSQAHRAETSRTYQTLAEHAQLLGLAALREQFEETSKQSNGCVRAAEIRYVPELE